MTPEPLRLLGSLLASGLLGGPIGVAISLATTAAEKITGVDPEKIVVAQFNTAATGRIAPGPEAPAMSRASTIAPTPSASAHFAMTPTQLAAYGVRVDASGILTLGDIRGPMCSTSSSWADTPRPSPLIPLTSYRHMAATTKRRDLSTVARSSTPGVERSASIIVDGLRKPTRCCRIDCGVEVKLPV